MLSSPITLIPNEVWLYTFALLDDHTLACVCLVSRRFNALATESLVRHVNWSTPALAHQHLVFWDANPSKAHLVRSVAFALGTSDASESWGTESIAHFDRIFTQIERFTRLTSLTLSGGNLPETIYTTLPRLTALADLKLDNCMVPPPPTQLSSFFPFSNLVGAAQDEPREIRATRLTVSKVKQSSFVPADTVTIPLAYRLPHLRSFVTDNLHTQIPAEVSEKLTSLTIRLPGNGGPLSDIQHRLDALLSRMPRLSQLHIATVGHTGLSVSTNANSLNTHIPIQLPRLRIISAPWATGAFVLRGAFSTVTHLRISSPTHRPSDVVSLLELMNENHVPLRSFAVQLPVWDDEVLLAATRCLAPGIEAIEVSYVDSSKNPGPEFIFNFGIQHLPLLPALHTIRLFPLPPIIFPLPARFEQPDLLANHQPFLALGPNPGHQPAPQLAHGQAQLHFFGGHFHHHHNHHHHHHHHVHGLAFESDSDSDDGGIAFPAFATNRARVLRRASAAARKREPSEEEWPAKKAVSWEEEVEKAEPLREAVCAWARYNPTLTRVRLGSGKAAAWVKVANHVDDQAGGKGKGRARARPKSVWAVDFEDADQQRERWEAMMGLDSIEVEEEDAADDADALVTSSAAVVLDCTDGKS